MADDVRIGVDVGSRTTKIVILEGSEISEVLLFDTAFDPLAPCREKLGPPAAGKDRGDGLRPAHAGRPAGGLGRYRNQGLRGRRRIISIRPMPPGRRYRRPGRQGHPDHGRRRFRGFRTQRALRRGDGPLPRGDGPGSRIRPRRISAGRPWPPTASVRVNSMCTVFAESEVVALIAAGEARKRIASGIYHSIIERVHPMIARLETEPGELGFLRRRRPEQMPGRAVAEKNETGNPSSRPIPRSSPPSGRPFWPESGAFRRDDEHLEIFRRQLIGAAERSDFRIRRWRCR